VIWQAGGNEAMQALKWVSKVAKVKGEMMGDLSVLMS
jgi:hypothetical protein